MHIRRTLRALFLLGTAAVVVAACRDGKSPVRTDADRPVVRFSVLAPQIIGNDTVFRIRVTWTAPAEDPAGAPDYYLHTATANRPVTDQNTGPLPDRKQVNGLMDTLRIRVPIVNTEITLTSQVWTVRRGLESAEPGVGTVVIRRGDRRPLPPTGVAIDTLWIP